MSEQKNQGGQQRGQGGPPDPARPQPEQQKPKPGDAREEGVIPDDKAWEQGGIGP